MSLKSALGLGPSKKVRYGVVALGDISQESMMPGVKHTGNSEITAIVTSDPTKAKEVGDEYDVPADARYSYEQFDTLLKSGKIDAIYLATPNWRHAEFAVPALRAGIHVLLEKPMEVSEAKCREILDAQKASGAKLMVAYRLHVEPATLRSVELLREGKVGEIRGFLSAFSQPLDPQNHRAKNGVYAGPLYDMGVYPLNAVRNLFESEPTEVYAVGTKSADSGLPTNFDHTVTLTLRFPGERVATFFVSYVGDVLDTFTVLGSEGTLTLSPAYGFGKPKELTLTQKGKPTSETIKPTDHFGGEMKYFSECILNDRDPEPDGEEGLLDVLVCEAAVRSMETGAPVKLPPVTRAKRLNVANVQNLRMVSPPELVNTKGPAKE